MADIYVDTSALVDGDGTIESPRNVWSNTFIANGNRVYVKRGTTITGAVVCPTITAGGSCYLGAYGEGLDPVFNGNSSATAFSANGTNGLTIEGVKVTGGTTTQIYAYNLSAGALIKDCVLSGGQDALKVETSVGVDVQGCSADSYTRYGFFMNGGAATTNMQDCSVSECSAVGGQYGFYINRNKNAVVEKCSASDFSLYGIYARYCDVAYEISNCTAISETASAVGFYVTLNTDIIFNIHGLYGEADTVFTIAGNTNVDTDSIFRDVTGTGNFSVINTTDLTFNAIDVFGSITVGNLWSGLVFADCKAHHSPSDGFSFTASSGNTGGAVLRRCIAYENGSGVFPNTTGDGFTAHENCYGISAEYCAFYDNKNTGVAVTFDSTITLVNCTVINNGSEGSERGGVYAHLSELDSSLSMTNCIVANNYPCELSFSAEDIGERFTASNNIYLHDADSNFASFDNSETFENYATYAALALETAIQNIDPEIRGNYRVSASSPAISAGIQIDGIHYGTGSTPNNVDVENNPACGTPSVGCFEANIYAVQQRALDSALGICRPVVWPPKAEDL